MIDVHCMKNERESHCTSNNAEYLDTFRNEAEIILHFVSIKERDFEEHNPTIESYEDGAKPQILLGFFDS